MTRGKIILLGDSITQLSFSASLSGWGAHLADVYQRRADVYNRGFGGYNTDWFLHYLDTEEGRQDVWNINNNSTAFSIDTCAQSQVKLVTIFFGANDASDAILNPRHHVPIDRFRSNLRKIVDLCRKYFGSSVRILFITPPPVHHSSRLEYQIQRYGKGKATGKLERTLELSGLYAEAVCDVAKELQLVYINLWKEMQESVSISPSDGFVDEEKWSKYLCDGLHLSKEGNLYLGRRLVQMINDSFPDLAIQPCPSTGYTGNSSSMCGRELYSDFGDAAGPWHDEIDYLNPMKTFTNRNH